MKINKKKNKWQLNKNINILTSKASVLYIYVCVCVLHFIVIRKKLCYNIKRKKAREESMRTKVTKS